MNYKYERVSTIRQSTGRQEYLLDKLGVKFDLTFSDKLTGKNANRPELKKLLGIAKDGDNIYCESISRLGRNVDDLRKICSGLTNKGCIVHFAKEGFNTSGSSYKFMLTILGAVAEMERETTQQRVREGIEKCKATGVTKTGVWFGRQKVTKDDLPKKFEKYYFQWKDDQMKATEFAKLLDVSRTTLYRYIKIYQGK
jgi:DNA invertase Pin-like site-specific DNA recombinase